MSNLIHVSVVPAWDKKFEHRQATKKIRKITGDNILVLNLNHIYAYGHIYTEIFSELFSIEETYAEYDCIITCFTPLMKEIISTFDLKLSNKIKFIENDEEFILDSKNLKIANYRPKRYVNKQKNIKKLKKYFHEAFPIEKKERSLLLYCSRDSEISASHGRRLTKENDKQVVEMLEQFAIENNLEFCFWNGLELDGTKTSISKQYELFSNAKLVVGIHGGAFSNIIFLDSSKNPSVIEICPFDKKNFDNLSGYVFSSFCNYYKIVFQLPPDIKKMSKTKIIKYLFKKDSTIDLSELEAILKQIKANDNLEN